MLMISLTHGRVMFKMSFPKVQQVHLKHKITIEVNPTKFLEKNSIYKTMIEFYKGEEFEFSKIPEKKRGW